MRSKDSDRLAPDESEGLIPSYVTFKHELNAVEALNIAKAQVWAFSMKRKVLSKADLQTLHVRMFGDVWSWAGTFRRTELNIGTEYWNIEPKLKVLLDDIDFWIEHKTYSPDEITVRFHHRLVYIHCFPNGNGRHARLAADILVRTLGGERFTWGQNNMIDPEKTRKAYVDALQKADRHHYSDLLEFVRS